MTSDALGATVLGNGKTLFRLWAPRSREVQLRIVAPHERVIAMEPRERGYHEVLIDAGPGTRYLYRLENGSDRPDPASRLQPDGVHAASEVVDHSFAWSDAGWRGIPLESCVLYELHVGTFTEEGTFDAVIPHLASLKDLGVTAVELMPVAQFPGERNWGYDGVYPYAVQQSYGGPLALKRLVDACHAHGLAAFLDVVYNHLGPEGNYTGEFAPYFTDKYKTPWGRAVNFDGPHSDEVRRYFIGNALQWIDEFHFDGLRFDAVHAIVDHSARPFLQECTSTIRARAKELGRLVWSIAESDLNDPRVIRPEAEGGLGFDAQWSDDFHHALHTVLTGESDGYYADFGNVTHLAGAMQAGYHYKGQYSSFRQRSYGAPPVGARGSQFVVCSQNHDQVGNRMMGERLAELVDFQQLKLAAAAVILSPFVPLIFMGEEYGEAMPFLYFTSHSDPDLIEAVRRGRREEFEAFAWKGEPPDPDAQATFEQSRLTHNRQAALHDFYRELLRLRATLPSLRDDSLSRMEVRHDEEARTMTLVRGSGPGSALVVFNFSDAAREVPIPPGSWAKFIDSDEAGWQGNGTAIPGNLSVPEGKRLRIGPCALAGFTRGS